MSNPKGNPGNKGGGRKSAYQERADARLLEEMFFNELCKEETLAKIRSGKYSLKDMFVSKAFDGNERFLGEMFRKLFPDKVETKEDVTLKIDV